MKTVTQVSRLTGVSVRTLHHYDAIGLLPPTAVTEAGYRLYDEAALRRLQTILLYRELEFPLREIKRILDCPDFDPMEALSQQIRLLELQQAHVARLISLAREIQNQGGTTMSFDAFDKHELEQYKAEAKQRWGHTAAYQEYEARDTKADDSAQMMELFAQIGALRHLPPTHPQPQAQVKALQQFITDHYYTCTPEILRGLGRMYVEDDRFRASIDRAGGEGTAAFAAQAIAAYCT